MVSMRWRPSADGAGLAGDVAQMLFTANSFRLTNCQYALVDFCCRVLRMLRSIGSCGVGLSSIGGFWREQRRIALDEQPVVARCLIFGDDADQGFD